MITTGFNILGVTIIALTCTLISGQESGFVEAMDIQSIPASAPVLQSAKSLQALCISRLFENPERLLKALIFVSNDIFDVLAERLASNARNYPSARKPSIIACLQQAIQHPAIDVNRACALWLNRPSLSCEKLTERVYALVRQNEHLSSAITAFLAHSFDPLLTIPCPFNDRVPKQLIQHKQAQEVAEHLIPLHDQELQPNLSRNSKCFSLQAFEGEIPQGLAFTKEKPYLVLKAYSRQAQLKNHENEILQNIFLPETYETRHSAFFDAALSSDHKLLAVFHFSDGQSIEIFKLHHDTNGHSVAKSILSLKVPDKLLDVVSTISELDFSPDNQWLLAHNASGKSCTFQLPLRYLTGDLTLEQIAFIRIFHYSIIIDKPINRNIALIHTLFASNVLESFSQVERSLFTRHLQKKRSIEQGYRTNQIRYLENRSPDMIQEIVRSYFLPGELTHLANDLGNIKATVLAIRVYKGLLALLTTEPPREDFSAVRYLYSDNPEFEKKLRQDLVDICGILQRKMTPEDFKKALLIVIEESVEDYSHLSSRMYSE